MTREWEQGRPEPPSLRDLFALIAAQPRCGCYGIDGTDTEPPRVVLCPTHAAHDEEWS